MLIAASEDELELSGEEDLAALPPSGTVAMPELDPEMMDRAQVETSTMSQALKVGQLVFRGGPRWFSVSRPSAILPGGA